MAGTGKVIALIKALGGSGASPEEIKAAVAEWLAEHVDPDTGYVIDDTFSIPGAAPDSKLTGDELNNLKSAISNMDSASGTDVGKALSPKTVADGHITEWQFKPIGGGGGGSFDGDISLEAENESATLGEELVSSEGWTLGTGWTGTLAEGFTHSSGTAALEFAVTGIEANKMYYVEFKSTVDMTDTNLLVTIGNSDTFPLYGMPQPYKIGMVAKNTDALKFIPENGFTGKLTDISIKEVTSISLPYIEVIDTGDDNAVEFRTGKLTLGNAFIGEEAGQYNVSGFGNVALGKQALANNIGGFWNVAAGLTALKKNVSGSRNVAVGYGALLNNVSGHRNIAIGSFSLLNNVNGHNNVAIGADTLDNNTNGYYNVALGFQALYQCNTGHSNIAIGKGAGASITTGSGNIAIGDSSLPSMTTNSYNVAIGYGVMPTTTGARNVGIGFGALYKNTGGTDNVAIGNNAGAGSNNASQAKSVFIGSSAAENIYNQVNQDVIIGYKAANTLVSGSDNVCIGANADVPATATSNYTNINGQIKGSKTSGSEWTEVLGDLFVTGTDGVKRQIVFNQDNTISWTAVT